MLLIWGQFFKNVFLKKNAKLYFNTVQTKKKFG